MNPLRYYLTMAGMLCFYFSCGFISAAVAAIPPPECRAHYDMVSWLQVLLGCTAAGLTGIRAFMDKTMARLTGFNPNEPKPMS